MKNHKTFQKTAKLLGNEREGLIVATFGATVEIEADDGSIVRCHLRKNAEPVITGDRVLWQPENNDSGIVAALLPRKSLLCRPESAHRAKPMAANIDDMIIVCAPPPILSEEMIDRYLVAAENLHVQPVILLNKTDLLTNEEREDVEQRLAVYKKIGYPVIFSSTYTDDGMQELDRYLSGKTCVLVGTSGVGKSSIIATLTAEKSITIGEVSASSGLGKHTTTTTRLYHLPKGGNLIDSPGVREFGLWHVNPEELLKGFIEFKSFSKECKFRNCQHQKEPSCAVQQALADGKISTLRFENYQKILNNLKTKESR